MYLVTGAAGFIGFHVVQALLARGESVLGVDNLTDYYDVALKQARLAEMEKMGGTWCFVRADVAEPEALQAAVAASKNTITHVIHLAAQAGVRYSLKAPFSYTHANVNGQLSVLELCRTLPALQHLVYASSSSVYGANTTLPFSVTDRTDHPVSLYAATKKAAEVMTESYARLYRISATGLRFFTVYGAWGRPDMAYFSFTRDICAGTPISVFNHGKMKRDFTYIDDIVQGVLAVSARAPQGEVSHALYNLGNSHAESLVDFIRLIEDALGKKAVLEFKPMQPGDVVETFADISASQRDFGFSPKTRLEQGIPQFVAWYKRYYGV